MPSVGGDYEDPLKWRFEENGGSQRRSEIRAESFENDLCSVKLMMVHRPTHEPDRDKANDYPFSWHLGGRKRLWELRMQLRFKRVPEGQLYFAAELASFVAVNGLVRQAQKALVAGVRGVVGDCYHSNGDDPSKPAPGGETESPTFAMPLWAFDQFDVSAPGSEPELTADLEAVGMRRTEVGVSSYIKAMKDALSNISTDRVYTFCLWGVSQFLDCVRWEIAGGILMGGTMDFSRLCGKPPVYMTLYERPDQASETRHLTSNKRSFVRVACWSALHPPPETAGSGHDFLGTELAPVAVAPAAAAESFDLLGDLCGPEPTAAAPSGKAEEAANIDLLGLM
ncbi:unnamed protein product [Polarella glacialis]|uniref:Domain of unknown function at the cortex 1 domain-containing protein n=1 Tax=Polarella glacialis TaxID=89957 RepID=A0A813JLL6_POLGL|nr:unnamed protein product [Polarella glacialis]CAE8683248.1 unnamed protein product [Polarella glacialis]